MTNPSSPPAKASSKTPASFRAFKRRLRGIHSIHVVGPMPLTADDKTQLLRTRKPALFIDGGIRHRGRFERLSFAYHIGDGDSHSVCPDWLLPTDKDISDLGFALELIPRHVRMIHLAGFIGGRRDHEVGNWLEILSHAQSRRQCIYQLDKEMFVVGPGRYDWWIGGRFSLFTFQPARVRLLGACRYQLKNWSPLRTASTHGLSNSGRGKIRLQTTGAILIIGKCHP